MLDVQPFRPDQTAAASAAFHRDGFVAIADALTDEQLAFARDGAERVIKEQVEADPERTGNRGSHRYSFGSQLHHPEWAMLIDLPTILPIIDAIWQSQDYYCMGGGGDFSLPGAQIQPLHSDISPDAIPDPTGQLKLTDLPTPFIVVNFPMVNFTRANGAIRFIPCTHRWRASIPTLEDEPDWMKQSIVCAPAGSAVIRDVRCWHAGTANTSDMVRPMTSVGYYAPWFLRPAERSLPRRHYDNLSKRGQYLSRFIVQD
ncbi:MAG: phytanoyl-CoA dioxygenase family protein [bacterium]